MWSNIEAVSLKQNGAGEATDDVKSFEDAYCRSPTSRLVRCSET